MESPNNRGDKAPIRHLLLPTDISSSRSESHPIELLAKGPIKGSKHLWLLPRLWVALHKRMVGFYHWRQHLHTWLNMEKLCLFLTRDITLLTSSVHNTVRYSACYKRRKVNTNPATNPVVICTVIYLHDTLVQQWYKRCECNQPLSDQISGPFHGMEPMPDTTWIAKNHWQDRP